MARSLGIRCKQGCDSATSLRPQQTTPLTWRVTPSASRNHRADGSHQRTSQSACNDPRPPPAHHMNQGDDVDADRDYASTFFAHARSKVRNMQGSKPSARNVPKETSRKRSEMNTQHSNQNGQYAHTSPFQFCAEPNHISSKCRHGQPIMCHHCSEYGHKSKFCQFTTNRSQQYNGFSEHY